MDSRAASIAVSGSDVYVAEVKEVESPLFLPNTGKMVSLLI